MRLKFEKLHNSFFRQITRCLFFLSFFLIFLRLLPCKSLALLRAAAQSELSRSSDERDSQLPADSAHVTASSDSLGPVL